MACMVCRRYILQESRLQQLQHRKLFRKCGRWVARPIIAVAGLACMVVFRSSLAADSSVFWDEGPAQPTDALAGFSTACKRADSGAHTAAGGAGDAAGKVCTCAEPSKLGFCLVGDRVNNASSTVQVSQSVIRSIGRSVGN